MSNDPVVVVVAEEMMMVLLLWVMHTMQLVWTFALTGWDGLELRMARVERSKPLPF